MQLNALDARVGGSEGSDDGATGATRATASGRQRTSHRMRASTRELSAQKTEENAPTRTVALYRMSQPLPILISTPARVGFGTSAK